MEVQTKQQTTEIVIKLTPRDFSSVKSLVAFNDKITAIFMDMVPADVKKEYDDWCKNQITEQISDCIDAELASRKHDLQKKTINFKEDDGAVQAIDKGKYYNAVFQHIKWEHAQQLLTLSKQLNIEFGKIESE